MTARPPTLPGPDDGAPLPPGIRVAGGAGGTQAHLEDLAAAAGALERAADAMDDAAAQALRLRRAVDDGAVWSPATAFAANACVAPLLSSWTAPRVVASRLRDVAAAVRASAQLYTDADASAGAAVARAVTTSAVAVGGTLGEMGPLGWLVAGAVGLASAGQLALLAVAGTVVRAVPSPTGTLLNRLGTAQVQADRGPLGGVARAGVQLGLVAGDRRWPDPRTAQLLTPGIAAFLRSSAPGLQPFVVDPVPGAAGTLRTGSQLATALTGLPRPGLVVAPVVRSAAPRGPDAEASAPSSAGDLLRQVHALYPHPDDAPGLGTGGIPGTVGIQEVERPDGGRTWVVAIPGTEDWSPVAGANPFDLTSNFDLVAGSSGDSLRTTVEAMTQAGIAPGEPVVLAGHSQGGIVAATIAADPALADRFAVAAVVTAGAPVGSIELPPGVATLHLEHAPDYVWTLDGAANPATTDRTSVHVDLTQSPDAADRLAGTSPVTAHGIDTYARTADRLGDVDHPSVQRFDAALRDLLGDGSGPVTSRRYVGVRVPAAP